MIDRTPYHIGFTVTNSFHHQATNTKGHTIFAGSYIIQLIKGMGLLGNVEHLSIAGGSSPISLRSLHKMGLVTPRPAVTTEKPPCGCTLIPNEVYSALWTIVHLPLLHPPMILSPRVPRFDRTTSLCFYFFILSLSFLL